jgi:hypothetical protein
MNFEDAMFHRHLVLAYTVTWVIHLAYAVYVALKWRRTKRLSAEK